MLLRAVFVLLLVINIGVAAWWLARAPVTPPPPPVTQPAGVPALQLLRAAPRRAPAAAAPAIRALSEPAPTSAPVVTQCHRFGPFADAVASQRAQAQLQAQGLRTHVHAQEDAASARGWHVFLPPQSDRAAAQALAERIAAAGFSDLLVLTDGTAANGIAANGIALGRYRSEDGARRRQAALQAAGFEAQVAPLAALATQHWLDVAAAAGFDPVRSARAIGAAQHRALDCAAMPPAPAG